MKHATAALVTLTALACFDPLYEDGTARSYFVCCQDGRVGTCECTAGASCLPSFKACAAGQCTTTLSCRFSGTGGGSAGAGGGGAQLDAGISDAGAAGGGAAGGSAAGGSPAGGGAAGGSPADGGAADGGAADGGAADGGAADGGAADGGAADGGAADGGAADGGAEPIDAGIPAEPVFELCCASGLVTTCECPGGRCTNAPFTACPANRCVAGTSRVCP